MLTPGRSATEDDAPVPSSAGVPRSASEEAAASVAARGVRVSVVRLPPSVHDREKLGLVSQLITLAHEKGVSVSSCSARKPISTRANDSIRGVDHAGQPVPHLKLYLSRQRLSI